MEGTQMGPQAVSVATGVDRRWAEGQGSSIFNLTTNLGSMQNYIARKEATYQI